MRFDIITLLPELFAPLLTSGITRRAYQSGIVDVRLSNPRDFAEGNYRRVDDRPYGGGPGMVMMAEPLAKCLESVLSERLDQPPVVLFTPHGLPLNHAGVQTWSQSKGAVLVCGRYEGIDQRFIDLYITEQISLGDFVLSGGEIAAMAFLDAIARLQEGVLSDPQSHQLDSFNPALDGLLDGPDFTRPEEWRGRHVPTVLISGNHVQIERWQRNQRLQLTAALRPDLLIVARQCGHLSPQDEAYLTGVQPKSY
jgi:tRNA (guanine37-N1)-methyltransferase